MFVVDQKSKIANNILSFFKDENDLFKAIENDSLTEDKITNTLDAKLEKGLISRDLYVKSINELGCLLEKANKPIINLIKATNEMKGFKINTWVKLEPEVIKISSQRIIDQNLNDITQAIEGIKNINID